MTARLVLDTNVFVAAAFKPDGACAALLREVRAGRRTLVWNPPTRDETRAVLRRIPRLSWEAVAPLFDAAPPFDGVCDEAAVAFVEDPADRKFAALALAAGAALVTADAHLLDHAGRLPALRPSEALG